jgi:hypothetical protein
MRCVTLTIASAATAINTTYYGLLPASAINTIAKDALIFAT